MRMRASSNQSTTNDHNPMIRLITATLALTTAAALAGTSAPKGPVPQAPEPAPAGFSYDSAEAGWVHLWADEDPDMDGGYLSLSKSLCPITFAYLGAGIMDGEFDVSAGVGAHTSLLPGVDGVVKLGTTFSDETSDWSLDAAVGFRAHLASRVDLEAFYAFSTEDFDNNVHAAEVSLLYALCERSQLVVCGIFTENESTLTAGLRWNF